MPLRLPARPVRPRWPPPRTAGLLGTLLVLVLPAPRPARAQPVPVPTDSVSSVFDTDTIPGFGAVGGVAVDALGFVYVADFQNAV